jgi:hypothetical protein
MMEGPDGDKKGMLLDAAAEQIAPGTVEAEG